MRKALVDRLTECWMRCVEDMEDENTLDVSMLVGEFKENGVQVHLKFTREPDDFISTGNGELEL